MADLIVEDDEEMTVLRDRDADLRLEMEREEKAWEEYVRECKVETTTTTVKEEWGPQHGVGEILLTEAGYMVVGAAEVVERVSAQGAAGFGDSSFVDGYVVVKYTLRPATDEEKRPYIEAYEKQAVAKKKE
ncbi:MAG: hypothetical protein KKB90_07960 [Actinobacteria bacterium]|nr:hypothetical protein [Actinomycetota bacterium]MCG2819335.1 hypothetical protein [Actinomycetes bacterium]MBU4218882.1 hypothetical protein [Actinomycetota bacterium]MBU4358863.1 hypothetical protein [Actinomycetota bacterium]MBU4392248.1 hypothetical protein [Actinomycetota bacterium]